MQFLKQDEVEKGMELFMLLLTALVPLWVIYLWTGSTVLSAVLTVAVWLAGRAGATKLGAWLRSRQERELASAYQSEVERMARMGYEPDPERAWGWRQTSSPRDG